MSRLQGAWLRIRPWVAVFDWPLLIAIGLVVGLSVITMYSAAYDFPGRFEAHLRNLAIAVFALWAARWCQEAGWSGLPCRSLSAGWRC